VKIRVESMGGQMATIAAEHNNGVTKKQALNSKFTPRWIDRWIGRSMDQWIAGSAAHRSINPSIHLTVDNASVMGGHSAPQYGML